jgi:hypothetical protein
MEKTEITHHQLDHSTRQLLLFLDQVSQPAAVINEQVTIQLTMISEALLAEYNKNRRSLDSYPTLDTILSCNNVSYVIGILHFLLINFSQAVNVARNLSTNQAAECAVMLLRNKHILSLQDCIVMFALAKDGKTLCEYRDRIDTAIVLEIYDNYLTERGFNKKMVL